MGRLPHVPTLFTEEERGLLYRIQTKQDMDALCLNLPQNVLDEVFRCVAFPDEGLALIAEDADDICEARKIVDFVSHPAEWVNRLDGNFLSALFVMNNSFTITLFLPADIAPNAFLQELED